MTPASEVALKIALVEMQRVLSALCARVENGPETATLATKIAAFFAADVPPGPDDLREAAA